jgi:AAA ATPase domain
VAGQTLSNFKSFREPTEVKLAPITVLAGANSSGKSTIIQSILLLKQTIEYVPASRAIGLNGPLLKLGRFDDIRNVHGDDRFIKLSWTIDDLSNYRAGGANAPAPLMYAYHRGLSLKQAAFEISFGLNEDDDSTEVTPTRSTSELRQLHPVLQLAACAVDYSTIEEGTEVPHASTAKLRRLAPKKAVQALENSTTAYAQAKSNAFSKHIVNI